MILHKIHNMYKYYGTKGIVKLIIEKIFSNQVSNYKTNKILKQISEQTEFNNPLKYIQHLQISEKEYLYSVNVDKPVLYNTAFAVIIKGVLSNEINQKQDIVNFLNSHQREIDGVYLDIKLQNTIAETEDWWGWRHLSAIIVNSFSFLNSKTKYPFKFVEFLYTKGETTKWLETLIWDKRIAFTSNTIMNYGVCLQYNRDFWNHEQAQNALDELFVFLDKRQDTKTGFWGNEFSKNENRLSQMEQTSYHFWVLYFYDNRKINYIEKAIDNCLSLQNKYGGFGPGYKLNKNSNPFTSACEDIDVIDPLSRFYFMTEYRKKDIEIALKKTIPWILYNQNEDAGFVFRRNEKLIYGHEFMSSDINVSNMLATWFRLLSLTYIQKVLPNNNTFNNISFSFTDSPGYHFWNNQNL